jgi:hypothetical protein
VVESAEVVVGSVVLVVERSMLVGVGCSVVVVVFSIAVGGMSVGEGASVVATVVAVVPRVVDGRLAGTSKVAGEAGPAVGGVTSGVMTTPSTDGAELIERA